MSVRSFNHGGPGWPDSIKVVCKTPRQSTFPRPSARHTDHCMEIPPTVVFCAYVTSPAGRLKRLKMKDFILSATSGLASQLTGFGPASSCALQFKICCSILPARQPSGLRLARTFSLSSVRMHQRRFRWKDFREIWYGDTVFTVLTATYVAQWRNKYNALLRFHGSAFNIRCITDSDSRWQKWLSERATMLRYVLFSSCQLALFGYPD